MREATSYALSMILTLAAASVAGAIGGWWGASRANSVPPIAVLDTHRIAQSVAQDSSLDEAGRSVRTQEIVTALDRAVDQEIRRGVVVLDSRAVVRAPDAAYVSAVPEKARVGP